MRWGRGRGGAAAIAGLAALLLASALSPVAASALDSDLKHSFAFRVGASNGYEIVALAASQRADGKGQIVLFVDREDAGALYVAPATLTATSIEADLGQLGEVSLDVVPSGRKRTVHRRCGEEPETTSFEPQSFRGNFEFNGEEGFTEASSAAPREYTRFFFDLLCGSSISSEVGGDGLPGARLKLHSRQGPTRVNLQVNKNHPGGRSEFTAEIAERRRGVQIQRSAVLLAGAAAFDYDPLLRTATLDPPAPFAGHASFHRDASPANRWTGNLTVDFPGRADVPLVGGGFGVHLAPAHRSDRQL
jgi:hypothetical protein